MGHQGGFLFTDGYGNTGCGVFKGEAQNQKIFHKNQHTQRKLLNSENWVNGEVSKRAKI